MRDTRGLFGKTPPQARHSPGSGRRLAFFFAALLGATLSARASQNDIVDQSVRFMGGTEEFVGLASVSYDFKQSSKRGAGLATVNGRHFFEFESGRCVAGIVEESSPFKKSLTIFDTERLQHWENDVLVRDLPKLRLVAAKIQEQIFWLTVPHGLRNISTLEDQGLERYDGKAYWTLGLKSADRLAAPPGKDFRFYFDSRSYVLKRVTFQAPGEEGRRAVEFKNFDISHDLILPVQRHVSMENHAYTFTILSLKLNQSRDQARLGGKFKLLEDPNLSVYPGPFLSLDVVRARP
jgi:hypothetical protein